MIGFSSVTAADFYILTLLVFMVISLAAQALIRRLWKTRIGVVFFVLSLVIGIFLLFLGYQSEGFLLILVFLYAFYVLATFKLMRQKSRGDQHEN